MLINTTPTNTWNSKPNIYIILRPNNFITSDGVWQYTNLNTRVSVRDTLNPLLFIRSSHERHLC